MRFLLFHFFVLSAFSQTLTVYTYDSFASKWGLGPVLKQAFEKKSKAKLKYVVFASAGEALNQIALEGAKTKADVLMGIDSGLLRRAQGLDVFSGQQTAFVPYDYGFLGIVYNSTQVKDPLPTSLKEFSENPRFKKKFSFINPRTSSVGFGFLVWTGTLYKGEAFDSFWKAMANQVLTTSPGWSGAYGLFNQKKADFVLSYTTSPAYHIENEKTDAVKCLIFPEGHFKQEEFVGIVKNTMQAKLARQLVEVLLSDEVQKEIPTHQWMYPVHPGVSLPASFKGLPIPKAIEVDFTEVEKSRKDWLKQWEKILATS